MGVDAEEMGVDAKAFEHRFIGLREPVGLRLDYGLVLEAEMLFEAVVRVDQHA